jgi:hypothetical protein
MGGQFREGVLGVAFAVLALSCATRGQSQPGESGAPSDDAKAPDSSVADDATPSDSAPATQNDATVEDSGPSTSPMGNDAGDNEAGEGSPTDDGATDATSMVDAGLDADASLDADGAPNDSAPSDAPSTSDEGGPADSAPSDGSLAEAGACGPCSSGFHCGAGNYCATPAGVPAFGHVFVIVLANQTLAAIQGSANAPYLNGLMATYPYAVNYTTSDHPSLPNYIELTSGGTQSVGCDCKPGTGTACNLLNCSVLTSSGCACAQSVTHLGDQLDTAHVRWREYAESMGSPCNAAGADGGTRFAVNHVPFLYYDNVFTNKTRCQDEVRDFGDFAGDLAAGTSRFAFITPNLCNDMHDNCGPGAIKQGDQWLSTQVPALLATPGFAPGGSDVLFVVADQQADVVVNSAPIPLVIVSPLAKQVRTNAQYNHHSLLATIEDGLGVPRLGSAQGAAPISDVWK